MRNLVKVFSKMSVSQTTEKSKFTTHRFAPENIEQYLTFAYDSFTNTNDFVRAHVPRIVFEQSTIKIVNCLLQAEKDANAKRNSQTIFNSFVREGDRMVAAAFSCEFRHFFDNVLPLKITEEFYEAIPQSLIDSMPRDKGIIGLRAVVKKEHQRSGVFNYHVVQRASFGLEGGYEYLSSVIAMPITIEFYKKRGAEIHRIDGRAFGRDIEFSLFKIRLKELIKHCEK